MSEDTRIGVCPFGCNSDTPDREVEFSWSAQEFLENDRLKTVNFYATCCCCNITFLADWDSEVLEYSEVSLVENNLKRRLKIDL